MRWNTKNKPKQDDFRLKRHFTWLPTKFDGGSRWLEYYYDIEIYQIIRADIWYYEGWAIYKSDINPADFQKITDELLLEKIK